MKSRTSFEFQDLKLWRSRSSEINAGEIENFANVITQKLRLKFVDPLDKNRNPFESDGDESSLEVNIGQT